MYLAVCVAASYSLFIPTEMFPVWLDEKFKAYLYLDKFLHATLFFGVVVSTHWATTIKRRYLMISAIGIGAATEITQYFISGRSASFGDFLADAGGVLTAGWVIGVLSVFTATKVRDAGLLSSHSSDGFTKKNLV